MYKRYYDGYGRVRKNAEQGELIVPKDTNEEVLCDEKSIDSKICSEDFAQISSVNKCRESIIPGLPVELDDLILIGILLFLLRDPDNNDPVMLVIIAFLLLGDII